MHKIEIPTVPIVRLGVGLSEEEFEQLKKYLQEMYEVFNEEFDAMSGSEAEFFAELLKLSKIAVDNHLAGKTSEADIAETINAMDARQLEVYSKFVDAAAPLN